MELQNLSNILENLNFFVFYRKPFFCFNIAHHKIACEIYNFVISYYLVCGSDQPK